MVVVVVVAVVTPTSGIDWLSCWRSVVMSLVCLGGSLSDALDDLCLLLSIKACLWRRSIYPFLRCELDIRVRPQRTSALGYHDEPFHVTVICLA